ncbi:MAG: GNAT family N-acetyltransferase [Lachnospiraceae bacterium]|nr:GNAT family N-acetyltransferase [Lachnospiraceae bacterium]
MKIRAYNADRDFPVIKDWITDERTHAMWCANRTSFPIEKESFDQLLKDIAERCNDKPFVALDENGAVVGFFCYSLNTDTREGMLKFVMVDPARRGKGLGREMIRSATAYAFDETGAKAVQLMVLSANERARKCYEGAGFTERHRQEGAFSYQDEIWDRINMVIEHPILQKCPSKLHRDFMDYALGFFHENHCKALLKGSIYKDTAHQFSDIDLVLKRMDQKTVKAFIYGYGEVALISRTKRPAGIIIVIYQNGLSLDLDFRDKVTREEIENSDVIGQRFDEDDIADSLQRSENIPEMDEESNWKSMQRLFHRSLIKWLGGNQELGESILQEIVDFLEEEKVNVPALAGKYIDDFEIVLNVFRDHYTLDRKYDSVVRELLKAAAVVKDGKMV